MIIVKETEHLIAYYHEDEAQLAEDFASLLENKYQDIYRSFGFDFVEKKINFYFCKDKQEFMEKTGKSKEEYQDWMVGNTNQESHTIAIISPNALADQFRLYQLQ